MPETQPQNNEPEARTPTGELTDKSPQTETAKPAETLDTKPATEAKTETKPSTEVKDDGKPILGKDKDAKPEGAPDKYEDFKAPEGFEIDKEAIAKALPMFKELGLSQTNAQRLVDFYAEQSKQAAEAPFKLWADTQKEWRDKVMADPKLGPRIDEIKTNVSRALDLMNNPQLKEQVQEAMTTTGAGNHPAIVAAWDILSQMVTEGKPVRGAGPSPLGQTKPGTDEKPSAAKALYPNLA